jgi:hypothetical protein
MYRSYHPGSVKIGTIDLLGSGIRLNGGCGSSRSLDEKAALFHFLLFSLAATLSRRFWIQAPSDIGYRHMLESRAMRTLCSDKRCADVVAAGVRYS